MARLEGNNANIYQLIKSMKEKQGNSIYYKNTEGVILCHNNNFIHNLKLKQENVIGKTDSDLFSSELAKFCLKYDLEIISTGNIASKQCGLKLTTGENEEYFIIKTRYTMES